MTKASRKVLTPHRCLKALRAACGDITQATLAELIGLRNFRSFTNIENGRHPLTRRLAARIEAETGACARSLMDPDGVPLARYTKRAFTRADFDRTRAYYLPHAKKPLGDEEMFAEALESDAVAYGAKVADLIRLAHRKRRLFGVLSELDYVLADLAEEFGLEANQPAPSRSTASASSRVIKRW